MLPEPAAGVVDRYLAMVDSAVPGLICGSYVVGSLALGGFRAGRSDIDFVATLGQSVSGPTLQALRHVHHRSYAEGVIRAAGSWSWPLVCNGIFLAHEHDLAGPPAAVEPVATQSAERFQPAGRNDLNPVTWWVLAHRGIALRGLTANDLYVHLDDNEIRQWTAGNLVSYWKPWAENLGRAGPRTWAAWSRHLSVRRMFASGVLGTARMHATIATGDVITKEQAGEYALSTFESTWHPIIEDALGYWRGFSRRPGRPLWKLRIETVSFVQHVIDVVGAS